ncbi:MAG: ubiquinone/menaquinone biosynthesis methyltransferase [Opitutales bacterium]|jgi:demethylmenaquinone methyltransferase/2-methoxy-6-polyprenyl-1,4-benzoquinol methylase
MPKGKSVQTMFSGISGKYDFANHFLSGGVDFYWRRRLVAAVARHQPTMVADLATGSGDVALALRRKLGPECAVRGYDFCEPMLAVAREKLARRRPVGELGFAYGDCMNLPIEDGSVDAVTIAFGVRNFEDRHRGLTEIRRVLHPQRGALFILEFTQPDPWMKPIYGPYLKFVLPHLARLATGDKSAYDYLAGSIEAFPDKESISSELIEAGFSEVTATGMTGSIVALHKAMV